MTEMAMLNDIAWAIKGEMRNKGMNASQLAKAAHTSRASIYRILNEEQMPSLKMLNNICEALNCEIEDIFCIGDYVD